MKVDQTFAREAYSHRAAVQCYSRAVDRVGLWACEKAFFTKHLPAGRILDLGCGAGRTTFGLHKAGFRDIQGADLSAVMIREARKHAARRGLKIRFRVADACRLPYPARSFEGCVFSFNGLMTIPKHTQRLAALREIRRVLVPGGRFVFTTHQRLGDPIWRREQARWKSGRQDPQLHDYGDQLIEELGRPTFVHVPDRREILDALEAAGLDWVEDVYPDLARESKVVRGFVSHGCRFWAAKR